MTRADRAAKGYIAGVLQLTLYMALQAVLAPVVLKRAGAQTLGAYGAIMQVVAAFAVFQLAFSTTLARYLAQQHGRDDATSRFAAIFTTGRTCLLAGSVLIAVATALAAGLLVAPLKLPPPMALAARSSLYALAAWFIVRTPVASYDNALVATQNLAAAQTITGFQNLGRVLGSLGAVLLGYGLFGMVLAAIGADLLTGSLNRFVFLRAYPERKPGWGFPDLPLLATMSRFAAHAFLIQLATMLTFNSNLMIAGYVVGALGASLVYTNQLPAATAQGLILRLADNVAPAINELHARGETAALRRTFLRMHRLTANLALPLAAGVLLFNRSLVSLWVGHRQDGGELMSAAVAALALAVSLEHVNVVFAMALGLEQAVMRFALAEAAIAVALSCVLGRLWGAGGIPAAVALAIVPKTLYLQTVLAARLGVGHAEYLKACVLPAAAATMAALLTAAGGARAGG
jgi:O-antigen/teichoic acid export membrane protein